MVASSVVIAIGYSLFTVGARSFGGGYAEDFGSASNLLLGAVTLTVCLGWNILARGYLKQLSVLAGLVVGYILAVFMGKVCLLYTSHQVLCITHLPQIAAMADTHFEIRKTVENGKTSTRIHKLGKEEQTEELARLLGGAEITGAVLENAREMKRDVYKRQACGRGVLVVFTERLRSDPPRCLYPGASGALCHRPGRSCGQRRGDPPGDL